MAKWGWIFGGGLVLIGLGAGVTVGRERFDYWDAARELPEAKRAAKEAGVPWVASELARPVDDADNAAPLLRRLGQDLGSPSQARQFATEAEKALDAGDVPKAATLLAQFDEPLRTAEEAAVLPRCEPSYDLDNAFALNMSTSTDVKVAVNLLATRAEVLAAQGDADAAIADLRTVRGLARLTGDQPYIIGMLVSVALQSIEARSVERIVARWADDPAKLAKLAAFYRDERVKPDLWRVMRSEAYYGVAAIRNLDQNGGIAALSGNTDEPRTVPDHPVRTRRDGDPPGLKEKAYMTRHLQMWTKALPKLRATQEDPLKFREAMADLEGLEQKKGASYDILKVLTPVIGSVGGVLVRSQARHRVVLGLIEVVRHRAKTGKYPANLGEVGLGLIDPYDGKPLRYLVENGRARIWSVGEDRLDQRGKPRPKNGFSQEFDEVAMYPPES